VTHPAVEVYLFIEHTIMQLHYQQFSHYFNSGRISSDRVLLRIKNHGTALM